MWPNQSKIYYMLRGSIWARFHNFSDHQFSQGIHKAAESCDSSQLSVVGVVSHLDGGWCWVHCGASPVLQAKLPGRHGHHTVALLPQPTLQPVDKDVDLVSLVPQATWIFEMLVLPVPVEQDQTQWQPPVLAEGREQVPLDRLAIENSVDSFAMVLRLLSFSTAINILHIICPSSNLFNTCTSSSACNILKSWEQGRGTRLGFGSYPYVYQVRFSMLYTERAQEECISGLHPLLIWILLSPVIFLINPLIQRTSAFQHNTFWGHSASLLILTNLI